MKVYNCPTCNDKSSIHDNVHLCKERIGEGHLRGFSNTALFLNWLMETQRFIILLICMPLVSEVFPNELVYRNVSSVFA